MSSLEAKSWVPLSDVPGCTDGRVGFNNVLPPYVDGDVVRVHSGRVLGLMDSGGIGGW